ncbi:MAG: phosphatase PAP2 family protein [Chitinophagaceae bacterium]
MSALDRIIQFDLWLFFKINRTWTGNFFDILFPLLRESVIWIPLYLFLLLFVWINFGVKGLYWAVALICTASLCDIVSSHIIKENIIRLRPCRTPGIEAQVRFLVKYCPMSSSFISSHATTHFGIAGFVYATLRPYTSAWITLFFGWAAIISYAQVYVGVHFPVDVFCGALVGCLLGYGMSKLFNRYITLIINPIKTN